MLFVFTDTATIEIYTRCIVGSVRCVQETGVHGPDDNVNFGLISFDHLISCLDSEIIFPVFEKMLETALSNSDWRYKNAGLLSIGQIGEYLDCLLYTSPSPRDLSTSRMPSSA
eukprot:TRINITY_DN68015_c0_g1_i1.p2 TRINITY_DN68015_c0_g1~~TRINITY_DN68015_c0_g1_i1.p2  ORF type:complete len:113 (+),score=30.35 TRINITY_DN68015_c0_g1_i1:56-394(+)